MRLESHSGWPRFESSISDLPSPVTMLGRRYVEIRWPHIAKAIASVSDNAVLAVVELVWMCLLIALSLPKASLLERLGYGQLVSAGLYTL